MRISKYIKEAVEKYGKKDGEHVKEDLAAASISNIPNIGLAKAELNISEKFSKAKLDLLKAAAYFKKFCKSMALEVKESQEHFEIQNNAGEIFKQYVAEMNIHMNSAMDEMFDISEQFKKCGKIENGKIWKAEPALIMNCVDGTTEILNVNVKRSVMSLNRINANEVPAWFLGICIRSEQNGLSLYAYSQLVYAEIAAAINTVYKMSLKIAKIQPDEPRLPAVPKIEFKLKPENILPDTVIISIKSFMDKELKKKRDAILAGIK
ncbi:MAG: hypothetical protein FWC26_04520 [Fibromonadales bacterium]|nr:hypothetical protein [Fibromonadales bacterium]